MSHKRGYVFGFDGSNFSGKSTAIENVKQQLHVFRPASEIVIVKFPGQTSLGSEIRKILLEGEHNITPLAEFLLFSADNTNTWSQVVLPAIERGAIVLTDRTWLSSVAFQGCGLGVNENFIARVTSHGMTHYDAIFLMDLPFETVLQRAEERNKDRIESRNADVLKRTHTRFKEFTQVFHDAIINQVDATQKPDAIAQDICCEIVDYILEKENVPCTI